MAALGSLKNIFENPMTDSRCPWGQLLPSASSASFEIFGEHFYPSASSSTSPLSGHPLPPLRQCIDPMPAVPKDSPALINFGELGLSEKTSPLQIPNSRMADGTATRTEEGRIECLRSKSSHERSLAEKLSKIDAVLYKRSYTDVRQRTTAAGGRLIQNFPPPITTIGSGGKPRVYFKPLRKDGRFVLKEIRIPTQRLLQSTRRDGRLTMRVLRPEDDQVEKNGERREEEDDDTKNDSKI